MNIYRLVTIGEPHSLTLTTAESSDRRTAMRELKRWADENNWVVARHDEDEEATCQIQELVPVE